MVVRFLVFALCFVILGLAEHISPRKKAPDKNLKRRFSNLMLIAIGSGIILFFVPAKAVSLAYMVRERGWALFSFLGVGPYWQVILSVVFFDLLIYFQHVLFHAVPALWRLHMVHHSDNHLDFTTGLRFHPVEILLSALLKAGAAAALGPPVTGVVAFEVILNAMSMFTHSNLALPERMDRFLRLLIVTPDMHRVHHSVIIKETNSNFGFNLSIWDRLFGTYKKLPKLGVLKTPIGLSQYQKDPPSDIKGLLILPFTGKPGTYSF